MRGLVFFLLHSDKYLTWYCPSNLDDHGKLLVMDANRNLAASSHLGQNISWQSKRHELRWRVYCYGVDWPEGVELGLGNVHKYVDLSLVLWDSHVDDPPRLRQLHASI